MYLINMVLKNWNISQTNIKDKIWKIKNVENKIPDVSGLGINTAFNTKIREVEKTYYGYDKHITTNKFDKFSGVIFNENFILKIATNTDLASVEQRPIANPKENLKIFFLAGINYKYFSIILPKMSVYI